MGQVPEIYEKEILVLGCGNTLMGDDGFGPAVAEWLNAHCRIQKGAIVLNAGTSVRKILFDITLSEKRPRRIIIVDAVDLGRAPGEIFQITPDKIPAVKIDDFSMHQMPTSNMLRELAELCGVDVRIIVCQVESIPPEVRPGLSAVLQTAVPEAARIIMNEIGKP